MGRVSFITDLYITFLALCSLFCKAIWHVYTDCFFHTGKFVLSWIHFKEDAFVPGLSQNFASVSGMPFPLAGPPAFP